MKIIIKNVNENPANALRRCGYHFERQHPHTNEISAARALGPGGFPKFHAYSKYREDGTLQITLHLDQKRPSYRGTRAHGGEYEGRIIEEEAERITSMLKK